MEATPTGGRVVRKTLSGKRGFEKASGIQNKPALGRPLWLQSASEILRFRDKMDGV